MELNGIRNVWIQLCWMQKNFPWRKVCDKTQISKHKYIFLSQLWRMDKVQIKGIRSGLDIARSTWISTIGHIGMEIKIFKLFGKRKITQNKVTNGSIFSHIALSLNGWWVLEWLVVLHFFIYFVTHVIVTTNDAKYR